MVHAGITLRITKVNECFDKSAISQVKSINLSRSGSINDAGIYIGINLSIAILNVFSPGAVQEL